MIRYSNVSLMILCDAESAATITATLGVQPTCVRENKSQHRRDDDSWEERTHYAWMLDSPMSHTDGDPTARLYALADIIEPFADRLSSLPPEFHRWIDILYHVTPQYPHGVSGEFDWFRMPVQLMRRFSAWDLSISYEMFWFDHPDWVNPKRRNWWSRIKETLQTWRPPTA
jgi:hypothetical protein